MGNDHMHVHPAVSVQIDGQAVDLDEGIVHLVCWLNSLPGVKTFTSCQGGAPDACTSDAFVGIECEDDILSTILGFVGGGAIIVPAGSGKHMLRFSDPEDLVRLNMAKFSDGATS